MLRTSEVTPERWNDVRFRGRSALGYFDERCATVFFLQFRYLAGKSHYFGLDGGTDELRLQLAKQGELQVVLSKEYPDGVRREVITIRRKSNVSGSDTN